MSPAVPPFIRMSTLRSLECICILLLLLLPASLLSQERRERGTVRGILTVSNLGELSEEMLRGRELLRYPTHGTHSIESAAPYRLSETAVIYLETVNSDSGYDVPVIRPRLNQSQLMFRPLVLPVLAGTTVDFPNGDELYHNVFSYSQPKEFDLGKYPRGQSRSVTFDRTGVINVYCDIHAYMYATILVLQNPFFAVPEDDGSYIIRNVPPGTYRLSCWYGRRKVATETMTIVPGQTTTVNFNA